MKSILLPTDFSNSALNAMAYAMTLFKNETCKFYILNVQKASSYISDDMLMINSSNTIYKTLVSDAKASVEHIISKLKLKYNNNKHDFYPIIDYDNFIDAIHQAIAKHNIDLVVMGTKGASGVGRLLFGSNTVRVINRCTTPILTVPNTCKWSRLHNIVFAANHVELYTDEVLKPLKAILQNENTQLTVLHLAGPYSIAHKRDSNMENFNRNFPDARHEYIDVVPNDIVGAISRYTERHGSNMLFMVKKPHSFLERLLHSYTEEKIAYSFNLPFLVLTNAET